MTFFLLLFCCGDFCWAENKIVFLISPPRSLSTGFLRMMEARGDFEIFHEPTDAPFTAAHYKTFHEENIRQDAFKSWDEIRKSIFKAAGRSHVFVKEMAFSLHEYLIQDIDMIQKSNVHFIFLVRKPQDVILSFYRKHGTALNEFSELICYDKSYDLFKIVSAANPNPPVILFSEDLGENPAETVAYFCQKVGIPFKSEALSWPDLGAEFTGHKEWKEGKKGVKQVHYWHGDAIRSTSFLPLKTSDTDKEGNPTFSEIENPEARRICQEVYRFSLPYYLNFKDSAAALDTHADRD